MEKSPGGNEDDADTQLPYGSLEGVDGPLSLWRHGSQPLMLLLFHDEACSLPRTWNVDGLGHRLNYPKEVLEPGKVLHCIGPAFLK